MRELFLAGLLAWLFILLVYLVILPDKIRTEQYEWGRKLQCRELGDRILQRPSRTSSKATR